MTLDFEFLGDCYNLAIALNKKFNLPICVLYGERWDNSMEEKIIIHVGVINHGFFFDEKGNQGTPEDVLELFKLKNEKYDHTSIKIFKSSQDENFIKLINLCGGKIINKKINFFINWIESNASLFDFY